MDSHVRKSRGDHQKSLVYLKGLHGDDGAEVADSRVVKESRRLREAIQPEEENQVFLAYQCMRGNMTSVDFAIVAKAVFVLGGQVSQNYASARFYREVQEVASQCLFETLLQCVRTSPVLCVQCDEGQEGHFVIRVNYLDADFKARSSFWELRIMGAKNHQSLCQAIMESFCCEGRLLRSEFGHKLLACVKCQNNFS